MNGVIVAAVAMGAAAALSSSSSSKPKPDYSSFGGAHASGDTESTVGGVKDAAAEASWKNLFGLWGAVDGDWHSLFGLAGGADKVAGDAANAADRIKRALRTVVVVGAIGGAAYVAWKVYTR